jgi:hypothetical protein
MLSSTMRELSVLLDGQLWYWGQDILHPQGNALLRYGFHRVRGADDGTQRSSAYELSGPYAPVEHGLSALVAWGFGVSASHSTLGASYGHLSLVRHEYAPGLCAAPLEAVPGTRDLLPKRHLPTTPGEWDCLCTTLVAVAHCCAQYEAWSQQFLGTAHREDAQQRRPRAVRRKHPQPPFLDSAWLAMADRVVSDSRSLRDPAAGA